MGKKHRLNRFVSKWIKSYSFVDLPEEKKSPALLLAVTRIATSPPPLRRPQSLPVHSAYFLEEPTNKPSNPVEDDVLVDKASPGVTKKLTRLKDMERSVDSIGTCSLDVDTSAELPADWSEASSTGTLRSASLASPAEPHLPSYLSLACTINGYSSSTNYDPIKLARSRDASPHRLDDQKAKLTYQIQNHLLSPPNLVPLPQKTMAENTYKLIELYSSTILAKESLLSFTKDSIDGCMDKTKKVIQNGTTTTTKKTETSSKSFIQQRVERLYGPGALAQGFFVSKRQKNRLSESDTSSNDLPETNQHSKSLNHDLYPEQEPVTMKQSTSSPTLPVLRHLRPEFRAQLPIMSPRSKEGVIQKSVTIPKINKAASPPPPVKETTVKVTVLDEKNGHYFLQILHEQSERLLGLAEKTEQLLQEPNLSEEIIGKIRSAAGKARLLVSQKMQQFQGLCTNNLNQNPGDAFPTTNEDLEGFWDMVMLQVDQVDALFKEIEALRANNWQELELKSEIKTRKQPNKVRIALTTKTVANEEARKQRELKRKQILEERRKAMKAAHNQKSSIEIFVPESS